MGRPDPRKAARFGSRTYEPKERKDRVFPLARSGPCALDLQALPSSLEASTRPPVAGLRSAPSGATARGPAGLRGTEAPRPPRMQVGEGRDSPPSTWGYLGVPGSHLNAEWFLSYRIISHLERP